MDIGLSAPGTDNPRATTRWLGHLVGILKAALKRVFGIATATGYSVSVAGDLTRFPHGLESIPFTFLYSQFGNYSCWATEADRLLWTSTHIYFRCSLADTKVQLVLISKGA